MTAIDLLNRRLGESLGRVCSGTLPRFAWKYAPEQSYFVYDRDNRTLLKKTWADAPAPSGGTIGKTWLLAEWRVNNVSDHHGFSDALRIPAVHAAGYAPYFETALAPGQEPTPELNQNYIFALDKQLQSSFEDYMTEERYTRDRNERRDSADWRETAAGQYDEFTGAFGNLDAGKRSGFMSFQNVESST